MPPKREKRAREGSQEPVVAKKAKRPTRDVDDGEPESDPDRRRTNSGPKIVGFTYRNGLEESLPPLSKNAEIFADMAKNLVAQGVEAVSNRLNGRSLRIATMCSGTESPLIAINLLAAELKRLGIPFQYNQLFAAEIVPFKQAFIERNHHPPIIFRDINELSIEGQTKATTAYGGYAEIPTNPDILVAGFSCVDFSALNINKPRLHLKSGGESGNTFSAMHRYCELHHPLLVILENVIGAPWPDLVISMEAIGYMCVVTKLDTKEFYIPHTRERKYMLCIYRGSSKDIEEEGEEKNRSRFQAMITRYSEVLASLKRKASSSVDAFLLDENDPRLIIARLEFAILNRRLPIDWSKCRGRHEDYRMALGVGRLRTLLNWVNGGGCQAPEDYWWADWLATQPERVWDTLEIAYLRNILRGFDQEFKL
jgi:site-specific DNA-cytosine methylase